MSAEVKRKKDKGGMPPVPSRKVAAPARHLRENGNPPASSFRTPRSGDPESSFFLNKTITTATASRRHDRTWPLVPIHSITHHRSGNSKLIKGKLSDKPNDNLYPAFSASGQDVWHTDYEQEGDAIVVSAVGARCGKCFLASGKWSAIANTHVVWPNPEKVAIKFLWYLLNNEEFWIRSGTAQPFVAVRKTFEKEIHLPPLLVQWEIVAEIEKQFTRLDAGVAALRRVQANLKRYRAAALKAACEGRLVHTEAELAKVEGRTYETGEQLLARILVDRRKNWHGRGKYKEPAVSDHRGLPEFPKHWTIASLEQLTSATRPICYGILMPKEHVPGGVLYVKVKDMKNDRIDVSSLNRTAPEIAAKYSRASLKAGDLLLSIRGTYGRVVEAPEELDGGNITQDTARLDVTKLVDHRFVALCLRNPDCQNYFKRVARGVAVKGVNIADVRTTPVPLPPLAEQKLIVAGVERCLSVIEELEAAVTANLQRATRLRQSILRRAFVRDIGETSL